MHLKYVIGYFIFIEGIAETSNREKFLQNNSDGVKKIFRSTFSYATHSSAPIQR